MGQTGAQAYSMTVSGALSDFAGDDTEWDLGVVYSQTLTVTGAAGAVTWAMTSGALPAGLTLGSTTGVIDGTPTTAGSSTFTVVATDAQSQTGSRAYSMQLRAR